MKTAGLGDVRLLVLAALVAGVFLAISGIPGSATAPVGVTNTTLARGTDMSDGTIPLKQGMDVVVAHNVFAPSGSSGWHSHPGGAIGVVKSGQVTLYVSTGSKCDATTYQAGQSFIERPDKVLKAVNTGTTDADVYVMFPSVPQGLPSRNDEADPGTC